MKNNTRGFTLIEIMLVVAIIAMLASIAVTNFYRAKIAANDTAALSTLRAVSHAIESYSSAKNGSFPMNFTSLTAATPPFIRSVPCDKTQNGFFYNCWFNATGYFLQATPTSMGVTGTNSISIITGGVLIP